MDAISLWRRRPPSAPPLLLMHSRRLKSSSVEARCAMMKGVVDCRVWIVDIRFRLEGRACINHMHTYTFGFRTNGGMTRSGYEMSRAQR